MNTYSFKSYSSPSTSEALKSYWKDIEKNKKSLNFFQSYEWNQAVFQHLFEESTVFCVVVFLSNNPVAIFPLQRSSFRCLISVPILQFPTHAHITLSDCICQDSDYPALVPELINYLFASSSNRWMFVNFYALPEDADLLRLMEFSNQNLLYHSTPAKTSSYISCKNSYQESTSHMTGKFLKNVRRLQNKADREGEVRYTSATNTLEDIDEFFQTFLAVEADGWKGEEGTAIKCNPQLINFYQQLSKVNEKALTAVINVLYLDDIPIATQLGLKLNNQLNLLKIGFSEKYKHLGPGNIILAKTITHFVAHNTQRISFVTEPPWAEKWKSGAENIVNLTVFNKSCLAIFIYSIFKARKKYKYYQAQIPEKCIQKLIARIKNIPNPTT